MKIIGMTRVRNEELLITDLLRHMLQWCDEIVVFDDDSTDATRHLIDLFDANVHLVTGGSWRVDRLSEETAHRAQLLNHARQLGGDWVVYLDADERLDFDLRALLKSRRDRASALRFTLFDAYLSRSSSDAYVGGPLHQTQRLFGPECRHILMAWKTDASASFVGQDQREPTLGIFESVETGGWNVMHYGKAISVDAWERKCEYYATHFPEPYRSKWHARKGKAIHDASDFGNPLLKWQSLDPSTAVDITPSQNWKSLARRVLVTLQFIHPLASRGYSAK